MTPLAATTSPIETHPASRLGPMVRPSLDPDGKASLDGHTVLERCVQVLQLEPERLDSLPFFGRDATAGSETELQVAVLGRRDAVDLPQTILNSRFYANLVQRAERNKSARRVLDGVERYLGQNAGGAEAVWENSWVALATDGLTPRAREILRRDLQSVPDDPASGARGDVDRFRFNQGSGERLRIPISYLLRLALADSLSRGTENSGASLPLRRTGDRLMRHFLNDNTSPETSSFHVVSLGGEQGYGEALASETARRFLLSQSLASYANRALGLEDSGQKAVVFHSPLAPVRQRQLNDTIPDNFYRELFISPCLAWARGEDKQDYMRLCHKVMSRSHLHAVSRLRDAGILASNLAFLTSASNSSLANNGTHVSLGSQRLRRLRVDKASGFGPAQEKYVGDLVIKFYEHFLPLFVGTYSAAPYRFDFDEFHPERVLGFLPHELDDQHLRALWSAWKRKAKNHLVGQPLSPSGFPVIDRLVASSCRFRGDWIPDFRLIEYLVALGSTDESPALDGSLGSEARLKGDLEDLGIFDRRMSLYLPYKLRTFEKMGFCGYEARYYSLFESASDLARATDMQQWICALAYQLMARGDLRHEHIPDRPAIESERRQIFFAAALGLPYFDVHAATPNTWLMRIMRRTRGVRPSPQRAGFLRVPLSAYRLALLGVLEEDGAALIEAMGLAGSVADLRRRLEEPRRYSVSARLDREIVERLGVRSAFEVPARAYNLAAEDFYREELQRRHLGEAFDYLRRSLSALECDGLHAREFASDWRGFLAGLPARIASDRVSGDEWQRLIHLLVLAEHGESGESDWSLSEAS